ncbi:hypothetical protein B0H19DRAFT_1365228 [Mycena capillaripes]|nr:hypothetical protein B0H19DRAFT_1365228 [Mycena capillaripes]
MILGAADLAYHFPGSRPSSCTAEKAGGGAKWVYLRCVAFPDAPAVRIPSEASFPFSADDSPHPFCVDENPRLSACAAWDCLHALRTHIASISSIFSGVIQRGIHESVPTAIHAAFSHTGSFSVHSGVPWARLFSTQPLCVHTLIPILTSKRAPARTLDDLPLPPFPAVGRRHAARLAAPLTARAHDLQHDGSARDLRHDLEAATYPLPRARRSARDAAEDPHAAFVSSPRTGPFSAVYQVPPSPLEARTSRAPLHHLPRLQRTPWPFPIASAAFVASSRTKSVAEHGEGSA